MRRCSASWRWCGVILRGRPNRTPRSLARLRPSPVLARISSRSQTQARKVARELLKRADTIVKHAQTGTTPLELARACKAWARVPAGIANARARSVAAPIANREPQKSTAEGRKCGQLFSVEREGGRGPRREHVANRTQHRTNFAHSATASRSRRNHNARWHGVHQGRHVLRATISRAAKAEEIERGGHDGDQ